MFKNTVIEAVLHFNPLSKTGGKKKSNIYFLNAMPFFRKTQVVSILREVLKRMIKSNCALVLQLKD